MTIVHEQKLENVGKANKMEQPNNIRHNREQPTTLGASWLLGEKRHDRDPSLLTRPTFFTTPHSSQTSFVSLNLIQNTVEKL